MRLVRRQESKQVNPHRYTLYLMSALSEHIQPELSPNRSSILKLWNHSWGLYRREGMPIASHLWENKWSYDHTKPIRRGDNPDKKTLIDMPSSVYSHSLVVLAKIGLKWGYNLTIGWMYLSQIGASDRWFDTSNVRASPSAGCPIMRGISRQ